MVGRNRSFSDATLIEVACVASVNREEVGRQKTSLCLSPLSHSPSPRFYACYAVYEGTIELRPDGRLGLS